jgi:DNA-binding transcriptional MerR regulator
METTEYLTIAEASARSGLSQDTLRYYDRLGLLPNLKRNGGRRMFSELNMHALMVITRLRDTGMPLAEIRKFMQASGPGLADTRLKLFRRHRAKVEERLEMFRKVMLLLDFKVWFYEEARRLGGLEKVLPFEEAVARYRRETGRSTDW